MLSDLGLNWSIWTTCFALACAKGGIPNIPTCLQFETTKQEHVKAMPPTCVHYVETKFFACPTRFEVIILHQHIRKLHFQLSIFSRTTKWTVNIEMRAAFKVESEFADNIFRHSIIILKPDLSKRVSVSWACTCIGAVPCASEWRDSSLISNTKHHFQLFNQENLLTCHGQNHNEGIHEVQSCHWVVDACC